MFTLSTVLVATTVAYKLHVYWSLFDQAKETNKSRKATYKELIHD